MPHRTQCCVEKIEKEIRKSHNVVMENQKLKNYRNVITK